MPNVFINARLENGQTVIEKLRELADGEIKARVYKTLLQGSEIVAAEARRRAPVGTRPSRKGVSTGRLRRSIKTFSNANDKKRAIVRIAADYPEQAGIRKSKTRKQAAGSKEYYAFAVEYGTRKMSAQPFLNPALEAKSSEVTKSAEKWNNVL